MSLTRWLKESAYESPGIWGLGAWMTASSLQGKAGATSPTQAPARPSSYKMTLVTQCLTPKVRPTGPWGSWRQAVQIGSIDKFGKCPIKLNEVASLVQDLSGPLKFQSQEHPEGPRREQSRQHVQQI